MFDVMGDTEHDKQMNVSFIQLHVCYRSLNHSNGFFPKAADSALQCAPLTLHYTSACSAFTEDLKPLVRPFSLLTSAGKRLSDFPSSRACNVS